ncbi:MAG: hypothetical protein ACKVON_17355 [Beijerinckiaceae bacterium]
MAQRAFYSINDDVLVRFNAIVPPRKRSGIVQLLMAKHVAEQELRITEAARLIETDPDFAKIRAVSGDADVMALEALTRN